MTTLIIPAYNESANIGNLLENIPDMFNVIVVDDGSNDNTHEVVKSHGYQPIILEKNYGKARACIEGVKNTKTDTCIFIDSDGQLNVKESTKIAHALKDADVVIGQRDMGEVPLQRRLANRFASRAINYLTNRDFTDVLCGFRGVKKQAFERMEMKKVGYFFESEMLIEAHKKNLKIKTVPVSVDYSVGSRMPVHKSLSIAAWLSFLCMKKFIKNTF